MNAGYRNWCFTSYIEPKPSYDEISYMVYQKERCPTTGREHYQGYVELTNKIRLNRVKEIFNDNTIHLENRKGSQKQAIDYCTKDKTRVEDCKPVFFGLPKNQGHRTDLDEIYEDIEEGLTAREILRAHRGNALRHINLIRRGLQVYHRIDEIDRIIMFNRSGEIDLEAVNNVQNVNKIDATLDKPST